MIFLLALKVFIKGLSSEKKSIIKKSKHTPRTIFKFVFECFEIETKARIYLEKPKKIFGLKYAIIFLFETKIL